MNEALLPFFQPVVVSTINNNIQLYTVKSDLDDWKIYIFQIIMYF